MLECIACRSDCLPNQVNPFFWPPSFSRSSPPSALVFALPSFPSSPTAHLGLILFQWRNGLWCPASRASKGTPAGPWLPRSPLRANITAVSLLRLPLFIFPPPHPSLKETTPRGGFHMIKVCIVSAVARRRCLCMGRDLIHHDTLKRVAQALSAAYSGVSSSGTLPNVLTSLN
jgi:hypothetical protein